MRTSGLVPTVPEINPPSIRIGSLIAAYVTVLITRNDPSAVSRASRFMRGSMSAGFGSVNEGGQRRLDDICRKRMALLSQEGSGIAKRIPRGVVP